jgi:pimeloyl-ACP methyl ester carboxylesterase
MLRDQGNGGMSDINHREIETNGIRMHLAEKGSGPLVLMCHGFPESWYSWRHQIDALAAAGFHAVAPDMRGYGQTEQPDAIDQYTLFHLVGDMVGVLDALGAETAVIAGHDWGAPVAWHAALIRPDRFRAVIGLSVPYRPRGVSRPTTVMPQTEDAVFYQLHFQTPGVADAELGFNPRGTIRGVLYGLSGDAPAGSANFSMVPRDPVARARRQTSVPSSLPGWITEADIDFYTDAFTRSGFRGGLNWYRNIDRNWELLAPFAGAKVTVPALYVAGDRDLVLSFPGAAEMVDNLHRVVPRLRPTVMLPGCGHWTQQERPDAVNAAMIEFVQGL